MKKNIENLLFQLLESGSVNYISTHTEEDCLLVWSSSDPLSAKIYQVADMPDKVKVAIFLGRNDKPVSTPLVISTEEINNFLVFSQCLIERNSAKVFVDEYGVEKFNNLKENVLNILAGKESNNFQLVEFKPDYEGDVCLILEDKSNGANSIVSIDRSQKFNSIFPVKVHFQTLLKSGDFLKSTGMTFHINTFKLDQYPLAIIKQPEIINEQEFIGNIIKVNNSSKIIDIFNLNTLLKQKNIKNTQLKI